GARLVCDGRWYHPTIWEVARNEERRFPDRGPGSDQWVRGPETDFWVVFSPDNRHLAASTYTNKDQKWHVSIFDRTTLQRKHLLAGQDGLIENVAWNHDGTRLASASVDKTVKLWNTTTGKEFFTLRGHTQPVHGVAFSPDGRRLVSGSGGRDFFH